MSVFSQKNIEDPLYRLFKFINNTLKKTIVTIIMLKLYNCFQSEDKENKIMDLEKKIKESDDKVKKTERLMITKKEKITKLTKEVTYTTTI